MNIDDLFANDLADFSSVVTSLKGGSGRNEATAGPPTVERSRRPLSSDVAPVVSPSGVTSFGVGPTNSDEVSAPATDIPWLGGPAQAAPPATGRRAVQVTSSAAPAGGIPPFPTQSVPPRPAADPTAALSWLDDDGDGGPSFAPHSVATTARPPTDSAADNRTAVDDTDPLDFLSVGRGSAAMGPPVSMSAANPSDDVRELAHDSERRKETRELHASLRALEIELSDLDAKLDTLRIKEDAEITELETSIIVKSTELDDLEVEVAEKRKRLEAATAKRLYNIESQQTILEKEQEEEVVRATSSQYLRQLKQLEGTIQSLSSSIADLREQHALIVQQHPYDKDGLLLAISAAADESTDGIDDPHYSEDDFEHSAASAPSVPVPPVLPEGSPFFPSAIVRVERKLQAAVKVLKGYCDDHLCAIRDDLVDYIHTETVDEAHTVRCRHGLQWANDEAKRKEQWADYLEQMMTNFRFFFHTRAERKQCCMATLHAEKLEARNRMKEQAKERLDKLLREVSAKLTHEDNEYEMKLQERRSAVEKKALTMREADNVVSAAQRAEVEHRCSVDASVRRQLFNSQREMLQEQLVRLRKSSDTSTHQRFQALRQEAGTSMTESTASLREGIRSLRESVDAHGKQLAAFRRGSHAIASVGAVEAVAHMHLQEQQQCLSQLLTSIHQGQEEVSAVRLRCAELQEKVCQQLDRTVEQMREKRLEHNAHQSRVEFIAATWEKEHRQELSAAHSLEVPAAGGALVSVESHVDPERATLTVLLEKIGEGLRTRTEEFETLQKERQQLVEKRETQVNLLREHYGCTQTRWAEVVEKLLDIHDQCERLTEQQVSLASEAARLEAEKGAMQREKQLFIRHQSALEAETAECRKELTAVREEHNEYLSHMRSFLVPRLSAATSYQVRPIVPATADQHASATPCAPPRITPDIAERQRVVHVERPPAPSTAKESAVLRTVVDPQNTSLGRQKPSRRIGKNECAMPTRAADSRKARWDTPLPCSPISGVSPGKVRVPMYHLEGEELLSETDDYYQKAKMASSISPPPSPTPLDASAISAHSSLFNVTPFIGLYTDLDSTSTTYA